MPCSRANCSNQVLRNSNWKKVQPHLFSMRRMPIHSAVMHMSSTSISTAAISSFGTASVSHSGNQSVRNASSSNFCFAAERSKNVYLSRHTRISHKCAERICPSMKSSPRQKLRPGCLHPEPVLFFPTKHIYLLSHQS